MNELVTSVSGPVTIARVSGDVDLANAQRLRTEVLALVIDDAPGVVLDLADVPFLDSAGVQALFELVRDLGRRDQQLVVSVPAASPLRRLLKITSFHEAAQICDSTEAAVDLVLCPPPVP